MFQILESVSNIRDEVIVLFIRTSSFVMLSSFFEVRERVGGSFLVFQILEGVSDIRDESDRSGMRIVIEV